MDNVVKRRPGRPKKAQNQYSLVVLSERLANVENSLNGFASMEKYIEFICLFAEGGRTAKTFLGKK